MNGNVEDLMQKYKVKLNVKSSCEICGKSWPASLIKTFIFSPNSRAPKRKDACPLCALKLKNEFCKLPPDTPFSGKPQQDLYKIALYLKGD